MISLLPLDPGLAVPPFGRLRLSPQGLVLLPPLLVFYKPKSSSLPIPNLSVLVGRRVFAQSLVFHAGNVATARFTNRFSDLVFR